MVRDLLEANVVLLAPGLRPGALEPGDFPLLGKPVDPEESIRAPMVSAYRFPSHAVEVHQESLIIAAPEPSEDSVARLSRALLDFVDNFVGRKGFTALGQNLKVRRRHPQGVLPAEVFGSMIRGQVLDVFEDESNEEQDGLEVDVRFRFNTPFCSQARVDMQPSRADDVEAVWFAFNFHYDFDRERNAYAELEAALDGLPSAVEFADRLVDDLLMRTTQGDDP